ncbi:XRCC1 [Sergentomyia squamirostris]
MPKVILKSIYSFSSEDTGFPASNLLKNLKWKSQGIGQESEHVTIQLEKSTRITGIDLGNEGSCFLGVFVAKSGQEMTADSYQEILLTSSFMTPIECRASDNINRVRCFNKAALVEEVAKEKWDFIKIVCSQPFNSHVQYGLSFITVYAADEEVKEAESPLGKFMMREDSPETDDRGLLFKKWKQSKDNTEQGSSSAALSPALAIRKASAQLLSNDQNDQKPESSRVGDKVIAEVPKQVPVQRKNRVIYDSGDSDEDTQPTKPKKPKAETQIPVEPPKPKPEIKTPPKRIIYQPFHKLLNGVIFIISGIPNPERGNLRQKALAMGAKYKPDWDNTCTHLICAFKNTPKYNQVYGLGKIVQKNWILDCYARKTRFPWRRYALDRSQRDDSESEDEVHDEARRPDDDTPQASTSRNPVVDSSGSDTDEEIRKVMEQKKDKEKEAYDKSTEDEDDGQGKS